MKLSEAVRSSTEPEQTVEERLDALENGLTALLVAVESAIGILALANPTYGMQVKLHIDEMLQERTDRDG